MKGIPVPVWAVQRVAEPTDELEPPYLFSSSGGLKAFIAYHPITRWSVVPLSNPKAIATFLTNCLRSGQTIVILNPAATGLGGVTIAIEDSLGWLPADRR